MDRFSNPFPGDTAKHQIWDVLVRNDFEGFLAGKWEMVDQDYLEQGFFGFDFGKSESPRDWRLGFPSLASYREAWLMDSIEFKALNFTDDPRERLYASCRLEQIEITGDVAMVHKIFDGEIARESSDPLPLRWRSLFLMKKVDEKWLIAGFCGYLKLSAAQ